MFPPIVPVAPRRLQLRQTRGVVCAMKSPKNFVIVVLLLIAAGTGFMAWRSSRQLVELRSAALNKHERADLQKRLWDAEKRAKALSDQVASLMGARAKEAGDAAAYASSQLATGNARRVRGGAAGLGGAGALGNVLSAMDKPEMQRLLALQQKGQLDGRYATLFKNLALTPADLDRLKMLLVEKQTAFQDVIAAARAQGINPLADPASLQQMIATTQAELDENIEALLGKPGFAQFQNYQETLPHRSVVTQLQQSLSYTSAPLSETQAEQMVQILARTAPANSGDNNVLATAPQMNVAISFAADNGASAAAGTPSGRAATLSIGGTLSGSGPGPGAAITDEAISLSAGVLSPAQVEGFSQLQQQQQAQGQLQQTLRQTLGRGSAPTGNAVAGDDPATVAPVPPVPPKRG